MTPLGMCFSFVILPSWALGRTRGEEKAVLLGGVGVNGSCSFVHMVDGLPDAYVAALFWISGLHMIFWRIDASVQWLCFLGTSYAMLLSLREKMH